MAKRKGRGRGQVAIQPAQAAAFGVSVPAAPADSERVLSPNDIGKILSVTGEAVKQWIYSRRLPAVKLANGYWKVRVADLEAFMRTRQEVGKRRVLITDTGAGAMRDVVAAVESLGHMPVVTHNYADALLKSLDHYPSLFIINPGIAEAEPWKLADKVRTTKALRKYPILLVAEVDLSDDDAERALKLGAQGFMRLPAEKTKLEGEIGRIMDRLN